MGYSLSIAFPTKQACDTLHAWLGVNFRPYCTALKGWESDYASLQRHPSYRPRPGKSSGSVTGFDYSCGGAERLSCYVVGVVNHDIVVVERAGILSFLSAEGFDLEPVLPLFPLRKLLGSLLQEGHELGTQVLPPAEPLLVGGPVQGVQRVRAEARVLVKADLPKAVPEHFMYSYSHSNPYRRVPFMDL